MDVAGVSTTPTGSGTLGIGGGDAAELQSTFMELMIQQLRNQDPFSPTDSNAFIEQLATLSNLEQLQGVNTRLDQSADLTRSLNNTMMMGLVGKRATVSGNEVQIREGSPTRTLVRTGAAGTATAQVKDEAGNVVRTLSNIRLDAGFTAVEWNGRGNDGELLEDGRYTIEVTAQDGAGNSQPVAHFQSGLVEAIQFEGDFNKLVINGRSYFPSEIVEIGVPELATVAATPQDEVDESEEEGGEPEENEGTGKVDLGNSGGGDLLLAPWLG